MYWNTKLYFFQKGLVAQCKTPPKRIFGNITARQLPQYQSLRSAILPTPGHISLPRLSS